MGKYCEGCTYNGQKEIGVDREDKEELIIMLCPGDEEIKAGHTLASSDPTSATQRIITNLPKGKTINDYAVAELVRCNPGRDRGNNYKQPTKTSVALCYRNIEELIIVKNYKRIITFSKEANDIVKNILSRHTELNSKLVEGKHPQSGVTNEELKTYFL